MTKTKAMIYCGLFTMLIAVFIKNPCTCSSLYTAVPVHYACRIVSIQKGHDLWLPICCWDWQYPSFSEWAVDLYFRCFGYIIGSAWEHT